MQKLITVSVDTKQLLRSPANPFTINEVDSVNELLEQGWEIEEWDFLREEDSDGEILLLVILNDDAMFDKDDDEYAFDDEDDNVDDDERDMDDDELNGIEKSNKNI